MTSLLLRLTCLWVALACSGSMWTTGRPQEPVDVNRATIAELMQVPGMTQVWAARIVRFRPYRRKTDLVDKGVVSAEVYARIRDGVATHRGVEAKR